MNNLTIIAEAGVNHNGSLKLALKLIDIAARAKACLLYTSPSPRD